MYEVVKVVNGYEITRVKGTRRFYYVTIKEWENGSSKYRTFHTIKEAAAFCETLK